MKLLQKNTNLLSDLRKEPIAEQNGVALIEFAIVIPVLILLLIVLFECGRLYYHYLRFTEFAWEGARFFSSLNKPPQACLDETTNYAYVEDSIAYYNSLPEEKKEAYVFHRVVQERVLSLFSYESGSWPIRSEQLVPVSSGYSSLKLYEIPAYYNMPTISTQYVGVEDPDTAEEERIVCPAPSGGVSNIDDIQNTVTVCLNAIYTGMFFDIPLRTCSTSHLLENNENFSIPNLPPKPPASTSGRSGSGGRT